MSLLTSAIIAQRKNPFPHLGEDGPRLVEEFSSQSPDLTIAVEQARSLWSSKACYIQRDFYAPLFEWVVDGVRYRYAIKPIVKNNRLDEWSMLDDLMRAYRTTNPKD